MKRPEIDRIEENFQIDMHCDQDLLDCINYIRLLEKKEEWLCPECRHVFPGSSIKGVNVLCPECGGMLSPKREQLIRERDFRIKKLELAIILNSPHKDCICRFHHGEHDPYCLEYQTVINKFVSRLRSASMRAAHRKGGQ